MTEITYLIGAGASCQALPIVSDMASEIAECINWLDQQYKHHRIINRFSTVDAKKFLNVIEDLDWLRKICDTKRNFSVDTYARKLSLSGKKDEYVKLKNILSFYFTVEQKRNPPDVRYDNFWASILKHKLKFPDNIKIVSWNYDFQFELTYQDFVGIDSLKESRESLNVTSLETLSHELNPHQLFGIFKLNGSATFNSNRERGVNYLIDEFNGLEIDAFIIELVETYERMCSKVTFCKNHLAFAWEHQSSSPFYNHLSLSLNNIDLVFVI
jgi:hypothetical protein